MGYWWLFLFGLLGGWLIELAIDYAWWRKRHRAAAQETARRLGEIEQLRQQLESRDTRLALREREAGERETVLSGRDADLLLQAKRIDERGEAILRTEQRLDARRAELEKLAASLGERDRFSSERLDVIKQAEARFNERQSQLDAADVEAAKREAMLGSRESGIKRWEQRVLTKEKELHGLEAEAARAARDAERWRRQYHGMRALIDQRYRRDDGADDLSVIHGIDRRAEAMLEELGISSFARLAETPLGELSRLAEQGGPRLALADPMSWAEQAALLVDRDFIGFESLKARLRGDLPADELLAATDIALESGPALVDEGDDGRIQQGADGGAAIETTVDAVGDAGQGAGGVADAAAEASIDSGAATEADGSDELARADDPDGDVLVITDGDSAVEASAEAADQREPMSAESTADVSPVDVSPVDAPPADLSPVAASAVDDSSSTQEQLELGAPSDESIGAATEATVSTDAASAGRGRQARGKGRGARSLKAAAPARTAGTGSPQAATPALADEPDNSLDDIADSRQHEDASAARGDDEFETVVQESGSASRHPERSPLSGPPSRGGGRRRRR